MSSTPLLERTHSDSVGTWVDIAPPAPARTPTGANMMIAISRIRAAIAAGTDATLVIETDDLREMDDLDIAAAEHAADRWDD